MAVSNLLNIGKSSLFAHQTALQTTGNNIANVDTEGYCRRTVRFQEAYPLDYYNPGRLGMGTYADEVYRNFNRFIENSFLKQFTLQGRWAEQAIIMTSVENIFNEANRDGINSLLTSFFNTWSDLSGTPDSEATRQALLSEANNLTLLIRDSRDSLAAIQSEMDDYINQAVGKVNAILETLRKINKQIATLQTPYNNPNDLYDERDKLVRQLAELIDIRIEDKGGADFKIHAKSGPALLVEDSAFSLQIHGPQWEKYTENFTGNLSFSGTDSYEYTLEFVDHENFRVSLDGGKTWLRDEDGKISTWKAPAQGEILQVKKLAISFDYNANDYFRQGDKLTIMPKTAVYWHSPTANPINITPLVQSDGTENSLRICGGTLAAYFNVRDYHIGRYLDKLDALSNSLIWEVNKLHSQGAGLAGLTNFQGTYAVIRSDLPLGSLTSGLDYAGRLTSGSFSMYFTKTFDQTRVGAPVGFESFTLDMSITPLGNGQIVQFDPSLHSMEDLVDAINRSFVDPQTGIPMLNASIEKGKLHLTAADGYSFQMGQDGTGLLAALGLNTFFQGSSALDISTNPMLDKNVSYICAQSVDGGIQANVGDGNIASKIAQLATKEVTISTIWENSTQSLIHYHASMVGLIGAETASAMFNKRYYTSLATELDTMSASISGVNLDEEMTDLIRFQHAYTAAAKLITTADQMLETILGLKQ